MSAKLLDNGSRLFSATRDAPSIIGGFGTSALDRRDWEQRLSPVTSLLRGWVWETDADHRFVYLSDSVRHFAGRPPEWHYGKTREELGNQPVDTAVLRSYREAIANRRQFGPLEFKRQQDDCCVWMRTIGQPSFECCGAFRGYFGIAYDIRAEVIARESQARSQAVLAETVHLMETCLASMPFGVAVFDCRHELVFANEKFAAMQGLERATLEPGVAIGEFLGRLCARGEIIGPEPKEWLAQQLKLIETRVWHKTERTRRNGSRIETTFTPLQIGGSMMTITDTTMRVEQQWRLDQLARELDQRSWELTQSRKLIAVLSELPEQKG